MSFTIRTSAKLSVLLLTAAVATVSAQQVAEKTATTYETKLDIPYRTDSEPTEYSENDAVWTCTIQLTSELIRPLSGFTAED